MHSLTETITRTAIDISGRVGSLYDGWRDQILGTLDINTMKTSVMRSRSVLCKVQRYDMNKSPNLARMIGIEDELRLSTLVNFVPKIGISSIIDYPYSINKYTRCFRYHYLDRKEHLFNDRNQIEKWKKTSMPDNSATHMITEISFGIDIVVILQLPPHDKLANDMDAALEKIRHHLQNSLENMIIASDVERLFDQILFTTVYSNIPKLVQIDKFLDLCRNLNQLKKNPTDCELLKYRLTPIKWFFLEYTEDVTRYFPLESEFRDIFENDLLQSSIVLKQACWRLDENTRRFLQKHLALQLLEVHQLYSQGKIYHEDVIQRLQSLIITIRSGQEIDVDIGHIFRNEPYITWRKKIDDLNMYISHLQAKADMISELQRQEFEYCNAADCGIQDGDDQTIIEQKLAQHKPSPRYLFSTDLLKNMNPSQWDYLRNQLILERQENEKLCLVYVDFSYCTFELTETVIFNSSLNSSSPPKTLTPSAPLRPSSTSDFINILLLGECGVGKSTFINALVNYITFKSLKQALSSNPIVLIPVSFSLRINDTLDEQVVKFDFIESSSNENHNELGHSVTQHYKSYVFHLNDVDGNQTKLRIIDTPGFGDSRSVSQDEANMKHILDYINHFTHMNAVCFLLKSNASQLNVFLRTCFMQLFDFLGENARDNFLFFFTNTRSTFFAPGNTEYLLKSMLESLPLGNVHFNKENTFCFDSESFRYLVAVQNSIEFNDDQKNDFETSWDHSVKESTRFFELIRRNLKSYCMHSGYRSIRRAQIEISSMIRPMLETMRNMFRILALWNMESTKVSIQESSIALSRPSAICLSCKRKHRCFGNLWINIDDAHEFRDACKVCRCSPSKHLPIDYEVRHTFLHKPSDLNRSGMVHILKQLCTSGASFTCYLMDTTQNRESDSFLSGLNRMIDEEAEICTTQDPHYLNDFVHDELRKMKNNYESQIKNLTSNPESTSLSTIYRWIDTVSAYPMIAEKIAAVKESRQIIMRQHDYEVPRYSITTEK